MMAKPEQIQKSKQKREPSEGLLRALKAAKGYFRGFKQQVAHAYELAIKEHYTPKEAKELLLEHLEIGKSTIYAALPEESKEVTKPKKIPKLGISEHKKSDPKLGTENPIDITEKGQIEINIPGAESGEIIDPTGGESIRIEGVTTYDPSTDQTIEKVKSVMPEVTEVSDDDRVKYWTGEQRKNIEKIRVLELNLEAANKTIAEKNAVIAQYHEAVGKESERIESKFGKEIKARGEDSFLLKKIAKLEHDLSGANIQIADLNKQIAEKDETIRKVVFPKASEIKDVPMFPETDTDRGIFTKENIHIDKFRNVLGQIKAVLLEKGFGEQINVCIMRVSE